MSWDEIVKAYPDCWVGLIDVDWEDESNVRSAVVMYTDRSADELALMQLHSDNLYSAYTTPDNQKNMKPVRNGKSSNGIKL